MKSKEIEHKGVHDVSRDVEQRKLQKEKEKDEGEEEEDRVKSMSMGLHGTVHPTMHGSTQEEVDASKYK